MHYTKMYFLYYYAEEPPQTKPHNSELQPNGIAPSEKHHGSSDIHDASKQDDCNEEQDKLNSESAYEEVHTHSEASDKNECVPSPVNSSKDTSQIELNTEHPVDVVENVTLPDNTETSRNTDGACSKTCNGVDVIKQNGCSDCNDNNNVCSGTGDNGNVLDCNNLDSTPTDTENNEQSESKINELHKFTRNNLTTQFKMLAK